MEDPWANAWGETSKTAISESSTLATTSSTWTSPSVSTIHGDNEDDLSTSSWSVQPTTHWNDPALAETSLWNNDVSSAWHPAPSTFDRISLSKDSASESETYFSPALSEDTQDSPSSSPTSSFERDEDLPPTSPRVKPPDTPPRSQLSPSLSLEAPEDIDAFGTFETADEVDDSEVWTPSRPDFSLPSADAAVWGATWEEPTSAATDTTNDTSKELDDAWERARQEKEKQDYHVPQELLASILSHFEELSDDLWPDSKSSTTSAHNSERLMDMEDLGLNSIVLRLVPDDLTLPPNLSFPKTFTSKQLSEALRFTRHSPLTRLSPIAFYMSSKGLTSWEASVKAKPNITSDDITPPGWKIVEVPKGDGQAVEEAKKKLSGGLLSFFGRRTAIPPSEAPNARRPASPASVSGASSVKTGSSPRPSSDSAQPSSAQSPIKGQTAPSSPSVSTFGSVAPTSSHKKSASLSDNSVTSAAIVSDGIEPESTPTPPSAVSRFFGRFSSRSKSSSSRDSLSLSADDLEFLSDVPTVDTKEDKSTGLDALSMMIKSPPLPTALPPPLKPPPRAPPRLSPVASTTIRSEGGKDQHDDFLSFFDDKPTQSVSPLPSVPLLTAVPMPPVKTTAFPHIPASTSKQQSSPPPSLGSLEHSSQSNKDSNDQSWPAFDYPSTSMNKTTQTKRPIVAIISSSGSSSTPPPLLPKPESPFSLPPPPSSLSDRTTSSGTSHIATSGNVVSPLPPPPASRSRTPLRPPQPHLSQPATVSIDDDDDFADFLSSPAQATNPAPLAFAGFASPVASSSNPITVTSHTASSSNIFDAFDDFVSSHPPQPPAKPLHFTTSAFAPASPPSKTLKNSPTSQEQANGTRKSPRVADHSRTLSLLESAAARGRWLGPPSPLPEALPPPSTSNGKSSNIDFFDGGSSMQAQQAQAAASLTAPPSFPPRPLNGSSGKPQTWSFPPPPNPTLFESDPISRPPSSNPHSLMQPAVMQSSSSTSTRTKTGGLSAQDLSFFEGL